jgi:hypothetical protein
MAEQKCDLKRIVLAEGIEGIVDAVVAAGDI